MNGRLIIILSIILLLNACQKGELKEDFRDSLVGTYFGTASVYSWINGNPNIFINDTNLIFKIEKFQDSSMIVNNVRMSGDTIENDFTHFDGILGDTIFYFGTRKIANQSIYTYNTVDIELNANGIIYLYFSSGYRLLNPSYSYFFKGKKF